VVGEGQPPPAKRILSVHRRRSVEVLLGLPPRARTPVELAKAEVAVGDEGPHAERVGECEGQSFAIASLGFRDVRWLPMRIITPITSSGFHKTPT